MEESIGYEHTPQWWNKIANINKAREFKNTRPQQAGQQKVKTNEADYTHGVTKICGIM